MPQKDREAYNAYQAKYQLKRYHDRMIEARTILGGICIDCGSSQNLEIDHVDWRTKTIKLNKLWSISKIRFYGELEKCTLRCKPCHTEKSRIDMSEIAKATPGWGINTKYK